jgi:uncharacterized membrane protein
MTTAVRDRPVSGLRRGLPVTLAALLVLISVGYPLASGSGRDAVTWAIVLLGAAVSVLHAGLSRGVRVGIGVFLLVGVAAVAVEAVGLATGFPYGSYRYGAGLGPTLFGVPFLVPLAWLMMAWPSWLLGAILARPVRIRARRAARVVTAAAIFAGWDVVLDPQLVQAGYWTWVHPSPGLPGIHTVPLTNLAGWILAGLVVMTLLDPVGAPTFVTDAPRLDGTAPLLVLGWMTLGGALAQAGWLGLPGSAAWGVGLAVPVLAVLALRRRHLRRGAVRTIR